jgi:transcriptional regulator with XRE-family HTH domain
MVSFLFSIGLTVPIRQKSVQIFPIVGACYAVPVVRGRKNPLHYGLPSRLRIARQAAGLTRKAVVQDAGAGQTAISDIETGQRLPTVAMIARLASVLGVTAPWLAYGIGEQSSNGLPATCEGMGARLASLRVEQGHTKAALARLAELSPSTVADIENGAQSGVEVIEALAQALGVSPGWLAFGVAPQVLPLPRRGRPPAQPADPAG